MPERIADHNRPYSSNLSSCCFIKGKADIVDLIRSSSMNHMCDVPDLRTCSINLSSASACCDSKSLRIITIHICAEASRPYSFSLPLFSRCIYDISMSREFLTRVEALGEEHCSRATQRGRRPKRIVPLFLRCILGNPRRMMPKKKWVSLLRIFFFFEKKYKNFPRVTFKLNLYSSLSHRVSSL